MSIFDGLDEIIDSFLGIDETWTWNSSKLNYRHKKTLEKLGNGEGHEIDGQKLIQALFDQVNQNWTNADDAPKPVQPNQHNWRRRKNLEVDPANTSREVTLERIITQVTDGNWWNQVPVDHTLMGVSKAKVIDLVHRDGEFGRDFEVIELKIGNADTPLSAAGQALKYGVVYAFYRKRIGKRKSVTELLSATRLNLIVLAPWDFYKEFANCCWLKKFESSLNITLQQFPKKIGLDHLKMGFRFETFPKNFKWSANMAKNEKAKKNVLWAVHNRENVFA